MKLKSNDRCRDCEHCKPLSTDHRKATCSRDEKRGLFSPDDSIPAHCAGRDSRK